MPNLVSFPQQLTTPSNIPGARDIFGPSYRPLAEAPTFRLVGKSSERPVETLTVTREAMNIKLQFGDQELSLNIADLRSIVAEFDNYK